MNLQRPPLVPRGPSGTQQFQRSRKSCKQVAICRPCLVLARFAGTASGTPGGGAEPLPEVLRKLSRQLWGESMPRKHVRRSFAGVPDIGALAACGRGERCSNAARAAARAADRSVWQASRVSAGAPLLRGLCADAQTPALSPHRRCSQMGEAGTGVTMADPKPPTPIDI